MGLKVERITEDGEKLRHLREWLEVLRTEPEEWILASTIYHNIRREIGDE